MWKMERVGEERMDEMRIRGDFWRVFQIGKEDNGEEGDWRLNPRTPLLPPPPPDRRRRQKNK
jgi:hypothetical protein